MANQRDIKNRIRSIKNTKKITSTMEMVSTAKMKKLQGRLNMSKPYEEKVNEIILNISKSQMGENGPDNAYFKSLPEPKTALILEIAGNRGLCGSYNTNVIENSMEFKEELEGRGMQTMKYVLGKKAINYYKFVNEPVFRSMENPDDRLTFDDAAELGNELAQLFLDGEVDEVYVSYTKVHSQTTQKPYIFRLFPIVPEEEEEKERLELAETNYIFEPDPERIFDYLLPLYIKVKLFTCLLESSYSEHFARRIAMKNATDASTEMIRELNLTYNRVRQSKITTEITEIVGGAAALE